MIIRLDNSSSWEAGERFCDDYVINYVVTEQHMVVMMKQ